MLSCCRLTTPAILFWAGNKSSSAQYPSVSIKMHPSHATNLDFVFLLFFFSLFLIRNIPRLKFYLLHTNIKKIIFRTLAKNAKIYYTHTHTFIYIHSYLQARPRLFSWAVWHSCRMGARNQEQTRGRIGPQLRLGNLRVGELHFCPLCTALDQASSLSRKLAYVPGPTFGFVKPLASSGSHCTKWADEQHRQAGFESRLLPDLPLPFIPTLIGLRAFDLVSSRVWWETATNTRHA